MARLKTELGPYLGQVQFKVVREGQARFNIGQVVALRQPRHDFGPVEYGGAGQIEGFAHRFVRFYRQGQAIGDVADVAEVLA